MPDYKLGKLNGRWTVSWWEDGKRRRYRLDADATYQDAQRQAVDVIRRKTVKAVEITVEQLWDWYREEKQGQRVAAAMKHEWKAIGPHFGHLRPDQITIETCRAYTKKRRGTLIYRGKDKPRTAVGDGTIWTELGHLRTVMIWAAEKRRLIPAAPDIERPTKPSPRERWLTDNEIRRLLNAKAAPHIMLAIQLMLSTAARVTAVLELTWERVDLERGTIDLRVDTDGPRKGRATVPMNASTKAALSVAKAAAMTDHVIEWSGKPVKSIKTGFNLAVKDSGLVNVTPHVLRHTAAVHLVAAGTPMQKVAQYLGHTSTSVTERTYARYAPDHLRNEADILDFVAKIKKVV